jgi:hypothetical protein
MAQGQQSRIEAFIRKALDETAGKAPNHVRFVTTRRNTTTPTDD